MRLKEGAEFAGDIVPDDKASFASSCDILRVRDVSGHNSGGSITSDSAPSGATGQRNENSPAMIPALEPR